jgi:hypothetical protein
MPKKLERLLLKFDLDKPSSPEDNINNLFLATCLLIVHYEDVVCRIFPYTFINKASSWYFNLPLGSISSWEDFEKDFTGKFVEAKTPTTLYEELGAINMESKEKVKDFKQHFLTILNKFYVHMVHMFNFDLFYRHVCEMSWKRHPSSKF